MKTPYADMTESELNAIAENLEEENMIHIQEIELRYNRQSNHHRTPEQKRDFLILGKKIALLKARANLARVIAKERASVAKK